MRRRALLAASAALLLQVGETGAAPLSPPEQAETVREGGFVLAPLAFVRFCKTYRDECRPTLGRQVVSLDADTWAVLGRVNRAVNRSIRPKEDAGEDTWSLGRRYGDCDDYAVEKRHRLLGLGLPASALSLTEVVAYGSGHLVLTVRTDRGDFVLDNLRPSIVPMRATGYEFVKLQSSADPDYWVSVDNAPRPVVVADAEPEG